MYLKLRMCVCMCVCVTVCTVIFLFTLHAMNRPYDWTMLHIQVLNHNTQHLLNDLFLWLELRYRVEA